MQSKNRDFEKHLTEVMNTSCIFVPAHLCVYIVCTCFARDRAVVDIQKHIMPVYMCLVKRGNKLKIPSLLLQHFYCQS